VATVVNISNPARNDIERDLKSANLADVEPGKIILLRIKPTRNLEEKVEKEKGYLLDLVFLCDQNNKNIHDCPHNDDQCQKFLDHFSA